MVPHRRSLKLGYPWECQEFYARARIEGDLLIGKRCDLLLFYLIVGELVELAVHSNSPGARN